MEASCNWAKQGHVTYVFKSQVIIHSYVHLLVLPYIGTVWPVRKTIVIIVFDISCSMHAKKVHFYVCICVVFCFSLLNFFLSNLSYNKPTHIQKTYICLTFFAHIYFTDVDNLVDIFQCQNMSIGHVGWVEVESSEVSPGIFFCHSILGKINNPGRIPSTEVIVS